MVSMSALLSILLLASATLAVPSSQLEVRQPQPAFIDAHNWAGAVLIRPPGTITTATGTFNAPHPSLDIAGKAAIWVGIDGDTCEVVVQVGIDLEVKNGVLKWGAWYEWYPHPPGRIFGLVEPGNNMRASIAATSPRSAVITLTNEHYGWTFIKILVSPYPLCGANAEWIVERFGVVGNLTPFADFGTVIFTNGIASGAGPAIYDLSDATPFVIKENNRPLTSVVFWGKTVTIQRIRS